MCPAESRNTECWQPARLCSCERQPKHTPTTLACWKEATIRRAHPVRDLREDEAGEHGLELRLELLKQRPGVELHEGIAQYGVHAVDVPGMRPE